MGRGTGRLASVLIAASLGCALGCKHESKAGSATAEKPRNEARELVSRLDKAGFYRYCETAESTKQAKEAALGGGPLITELTRRTCRMDTEKLSLGGVAEFMTLCKPMFGIHGIKLAKIAQMFLIGYGYYAHINDLEYEIYTEEDETSDQRSNIAAKGTLNMCNEILKSAGSDEQMYMLYSGHDAVAVFLTPEQFNLLKESSLSEGEKLKSADAILAKP